jgi:peptidoglycan/xylan/chitin deacetylase (PgdA/CDA1 family)
MKKLFLFILLCITGLQYSTAQQAKPWNGKQCAVVLTYDDALNVHLDKVIPALDSVGFKGTFYLTAESPVIGKRIPEWRTAAMHGHELGNHTLNHPCDGGTPARWWVSPERDLTKYTVQRAVNEIKEMNILLQAIDGKTERTFAFPCGDTKIDTVSFYKLVEKDFAGARGVQPGFKQVTEVLLDDINCFGINGQSGDYMIGLVKKAIESHTLLVFLFHGVGGDHAINVSLEAHRELIRYMKQHEREIWNAPLVDVARYIKKNQNGK